jgi:peroxiredoxin (alkyl hydroperoxide reductase subunit C)
LLAWTEQKRSEGGLGDISIPLLGDLDKKVSTAYGALLGNSGHTLRATYIIDNKGMLDWGLVARRMSLFSFSWIGILRHLSFNDAPVGRNVEETLRLVQAFQFTDKHGEVCPSNWHPGSDTIIPNPQDKLKFFSQKK